MFTERALIVGMFPKAWGDSVGWSRTWSAVKIRWHTISDSLRSLKLYRPKKTVLCYDIDGSWNFHNPWPSAVDSIGDVPMRSAKVCSSRTKNNIHELCKMKLELHNAIKTERLHTGIILNKSNILSRFSQRSFSLTGLKWGGKQDDDWPSMQ